LIFPNKHCTGVRANMKRKQDGPDPDSPAISLIALPHAGTLVMVWDSKLAFIHYKIEEPSSSHRDRLDHSQKEKHVRPGREDDRSKLLCNEDSSKDKLSIPGRAE